MSLEEHCRVALVTGGAIRVGRAITIGLHEEGFNVMIHCNSSIEDAKAICSLLNQKRICSAHFVQCDLSKDVEATCNSLIASCLAKWGRLDALVNNASCFKVETLQQITSKEWETVMNINLKAPTFLMKAAASHLKETEGCIVNFTDLIGEQPLSSHFVHSVAKSGLISATKCAALSLAPKVRVNSISPGCIAWPNNQDCQIYEDMQSKERFKNVTPLRKLGTPEDASETVKFLVSPKAKFITGVNLTLDGGLGLASVREGL